jgi:hypothetical protein
MIVKHLPEGELYDQEAIAVEHGVSIRTVRRKCTPVAVDDRTQAPLYDPDAAALALRGVKPRPARTATEQRLRRLSVA